MTLFFTLLAATVFLYFAVYLWKLDTDYISQLRKENNMEENNNVVNAKNPLFPPYVPEDEYFTQAEAQQLSSLLSVQLYNAEVQRDYLKKLARTIKASDKAGATLYYNKAEEYTQFIKKFGKLQGKLKHSIHTRG